MILMILAVYFCKSFRIYRMFTKILFINFYNLWETCLWI